MDKVRQRGLDKEITESGDLPSHIRVKRERTLDRCAAYIENIENAMVAGNELRETQLLAAMGFSTWINEKMNQRMLMGHLVLPMGSGKTLVAAAQLSEMVDGITIFFTWNNDLGRQTIEAYNAHQTAMGRSDNKAGRCFGGKQETDRKFIVGNFNTVGKWISKIAPEEVGLIVVDEADVNGLSDRRAELLRSLAKEWGIPVVGMSATEQQSSGKKLQDVFPDKIERLPMPDALFQLREWNLVPDLRFHDVYVDMTLEVDEEDLLNRGEINPRTADEFVRSPLWNAAILKHYKENFRKRPRYARGAVIFRDNSLLDDFVKQARAAGIKASRFTGEESEKETAVIVEKLKKGKIHLIVGSRKIGRGMDFELDVVYNANLTYSPQLYWQGLGRLRANPKKRNKISHAVTVLPKHLVDKRSGRTLQPEERPLCSSAFFDPDYFHDGVPMSERDLKSPSNNIIKLDDIESIRSIADVRDVVHCYWQKPIWFTGFPSTLARYVDAIGKDDRFNIRHLYIALYRIRWKLTEIIDFLEDPEQEDTEDEESIPYYNRKPEKEITYKEERALLREFKVCLSANPGTKTREKSDRAAERILEAHIPFLHAIAKQLAAREGDIDDLVQIGSVEFIRNLRAYQVEEGEGGARFIRFAFKNIFRTMNRGAWCLEAPAVTREGKNSQPGFPVRRIMDRALIEKLERDIWSDGDDADLFEAWSRYQAPTLNNAREKFRRILLELDHFVDEDVEKTSDENWGPDAHLGVIESQALISKLLESLTDMERKVIVMYFGLNGEALSTKEIAKALYLSRARIGQLKNEALRRLRADSILRKLKEGFGIDLDYPPTKLEVSEPEPPTSDEEVPEGVELSNVELEVEAEETAPISVAVNIEVETHSYQLVAKDYEDGVEPNIGPSLAVPDDEAEKLPVKYEPPVKPAPTFYQRVVSVVRYIIKLLSWT